MADYGSLIKEAREKKGFTQEQLGKAIGVTGVAIMRYEKGKRTPSSEVIEKIANVLGTDFAFSVIEEVDNSLSRAMEQKQAEDNPRRTQMRTQLIRAWKAAEEKEGRQLSFDEAMNLYRVDVATMVRLEAAIHRLNDAGIKVALERIEELTLIDKYTMPAITEQTEHSAKDAYPTQTKKPPESE